MAINTQAYNIKPDAGDAYAAAYRAEWGKRKPWSDLGNKGAKIISDLAATYAAGGLFDEGLTEDPGIAVEDGDAQMLMNGIDMNLMRRAQPQAVARPDNIGDVNPFTGETWDDWEKAQKNYRDLLIKHSNSGWLK